MNYNILEFRLWVTVDYCICNRADA